MRWPRHYDITLIVILALLASACTLFDPPPRAAPPAPPTAVTEIERIAREGWPDEFAGFWIAKDDRVFIAFTKDAPGKVAEIQRKTGTQLELVPRAAELSLADLEAWVERLVRDREAIKTGVKVPDLPAAIAATDGRYDLDIDVRRNVVVVFLDDPTRRLRAAFRKHYDTPALKFDDGKVVPAPLELSR